MSTSDDQTIRIWNWQSRTCVAILTGHSHYVMCANFHPFEDLVVSASLDQTLRVWDISGLRKKTTKPSQQSMGGGPDGQYGMQPSYAGMSSGSLSGQTAGDIFTQGNDVIVKYVLEGHYRGVNWASFHPTQPFIVSGSDDRQIKIWRFTETRAYELESLRGHQNNISCVIFHPNKEQDMVISNAEDKSIRMWDVGAMISKSYRGGSSSRSDVQVFRREHDRFWVLAAHPDSNLFAAGHDSGLVVFKLERERPAQAIHENRVFYIKRNREGVHLLCMDTSQPYQVQMGSNGLPKTQKIEGTYVATLETSVGNTRPPARSISYNPSENALLVSWISDTPRVELFRLQGGTASERRPPVQKVKGISAVFVARNRYALLARENPWIEIRDVRSDDAAQPLKMVNLPFPGQEMFFAGTGHVLVASSTAVLLIDAQQGIVLGELAVTGVKYCVWSPDMSMVALLSKHTVTIATRKLEQMCFIHETIRIKSGAWDGRIFVYSTLNHLKYALPQGDTGIIKTIPNTMYIARVKPGVVYALDREGNMQCIPYDPAEYQFKLALVLRQYDRVLHLMETSNLVGQALIAYVRKKGYPEIALHFVQDPSTRFELALDCGNLDVAVETAKKIDKESCWNRLAEEAILQGNHPVAEMAFQRVQNYARLSFLYVITGEYMKARKMLKIAELRKDIVSRFQDTLFVGDVENRVRLLRELGQAPLAYLTAKTHGLLDEAEQILNNCPNAPSDPEKFVKSKSVFFTPPVPVLRLAEQPWPKVERKAEPQEQIFHTSAARRTSASGQADFWKEAEEPAPTSAAPRRASITALRNAHEQKSAENFADAEGGDWDLDEELELASPVGSAKSPRGDGLPGDEGSTSKGMSMALKWTQSSNQAVDHAAAGSFETAMQLYHQQVGIVNFTRLKSYFLSVSQSSFTFVSPDGCCPPLRVGLLRPQVADGDVSIERPLPEICFKLPVAEQQLKSAHRATTLGKFSEALGLYHRVLYSLLFASITSEQDYEKVINFWSTLTTLSAASDAHYLLEQVQKYSTTCANYILGINIEMLRKDFTVEQPDNAKRILELAAYFTRLPLETEHVQLSLRSAMTTAYKYGNYKIAMGFAQALLQLNPSKNVADKVRNWASVVCGYIGKHFADGYSCNRRVL